MVLEYIAMPLIVMTAGLFVHSLVPGPFFKRIVYGFGVGVGFLLVVFTTVTRPVVFTDNLGFYQAHVIVGLALAICYLGHKAFLGDVLARWVLLALCNDFKQIGACWILVLLSIKITVNFLL